MSVFLAAFLFLLFSPPAAAAISPEIRQVKTADRSTVYFLSQRYHLKKTYINENSYLCYGNHWEDIRTVFPADLAGWPEAKLFRAEGTNAIYYIQGSERVKIDNLEELENLGLAGEPVLEVSPLDLEQYRLVNYEDLGLNPTEDQTSGQLALSQKLVTTSNGNTLVAGTDGNLVAIFRLAASGAEVTVTDLTFSFSGIFSASLLSDAFVLDENNNDYEANINLNTNERSLRVQFRPPLTLNKDQTKTVMVFVNLGVCSTCTFQTLRLSLENAASVTTSASVQGDFPLVGTEFRIMAGDALLGQPRATEESLATTSLTVNTGTRLLAKFLLTETSGQEDVFIKRLTFRNNGTVDNNDWEDFRLFKNGQVISRVRQMDANGQIVFNISYLRISQSEPAAVSVIAGLKSDYQALDTFNLQLTSAWAEGKTFGLSLPIQINNLNETYTLN